MTYTSGETIIASRIEDRNDKNQVNGYIGLDSQKMPPSQILMPFNLLKVAASGNIFDMTQSNSGNLSINNSGGSVTLNVLGQYNSIANINSANKYTLGSYSGIPIINTFKISDISLASGNLAKIGYGNTDVIGVSNKTGIPTTGHTFFNGERIYWQKFTASGIAAVTGINIKTFGASGDVRVGLYEDSNNSPAALLAESVSTPVNTDVDGTTSCSLSYSVTNGNIYWTAVLSRHQSDIYYKSVANGISKIDTVYVYDALPNPAIGFLDNTEEIYTEIVSYQTFPYIGIITENGGNNWVFKTYNGSSTTSSNITMVSSNDVLTMYLTQGRAALIKNNSWLATHTTNTSSNFVMGKLASLENTTSSQYSGTITLSFMG